MRKKNFKLIRKTHEWLHRIKGTSEIKIKPGIQQSDYRYFKIYGSDTDDVGSGTGDYNADTNAYSLPISIHGKNLLGGDEFFEIHSNLGVSKIDPLLSNGLYSTTPKAECNGTVIIGPQRIKFKPKTAYTIAVHMKYFTSASKRRIGMRFEYSDGSYDVPVVDSSTREFKMCFSSDPSKDLVAIASHNETTVNIRFMLDGFGIYEGAYSDYESTHEAFFGQTIILNLDAPLRKINRARDELDIVNGALVRKINTVLIDGTAEISATDDDNVFEISLPSSMRPGISPISPFPEISEEDTVSIGASSDGKKVLFKTTSDITRVEDAQAFISDYPFYISYVMKDYKYKACETHPIQTLEKEAIVEVLTTRLPSKIIAEYV